MKAYYEKLPGTLRTGLKYGFFSAFLLCVLLTILFYMGKHPLMIPVIYDVRIFLLAVFIFFALKDFREELNSGVMHFWQGMLIGLTTAIVLGFLAALFILLFGYFEDQLLASYISKMMDNLLNARGEFLEAIGKETYQNTLDNLPSTTLTDLAMDYYFKSVVIGLFLTIIISVILRRQPKQP